MHLKAVFKLFDFNIYIYIIHFLEYKILNKYFIKLTTYYNINNYLQMIIFNS